MPPSGRQPRFFIYIVREERITFKERRKIRKWGEGEWGKRKKEGKGDGGGGNQNRMINGAVWANAS